MKISLLLRRENFYKILKETLKESELFDNTDSNKNYNYFVNKYLNFIAYDGINRELFTNIFNEYSNSNNPVKNLLQKFYVKLATSKLLCRLFSHKVIFMPKYNECLILGGNHRLRLFSNQLNSSWLILKKGERTDYIKNDVFIRNKFKLSYAPVIFNSGDSWLEEEYIEGTPANRLKDISYSETIKDNISKLHFNELLDYSKKKISTINYFDRIRNEILKIINNKKIKTNPVITKKIIQTFEILFENVSAKSIYISYSHGDLSDSNILVNNGQAKVIDWECASERYYIYDLYVLFGRTRKGLKISKSIELFLNKYELSKLNINNDSIILCLIEDLRFRISEDFSENFYFSGKYVYDFCNKIFDYLNE